jgi:lipopolysaccharide export system permease protein
MLGAGSERNKMQRLTIYIFSQFAREITTILVLVVFLGWLTQVLGRFFVVTAKGQTLLVLLAQTGFILPTIVNVMLPAAVLLGLARVLRTLDESRELHSIHSAGRIGSIFRAASAVAVLAAAVLGLGTHFIEPAARLASARQLSQINADVIARASVAGVFTQIESGVALRIDGRARSGEIRGFFLRDDRDPAVQQTIYAQSASVSQSDKGIGIVLNNGSLQFRDRETGFVSAVQFDRYELGNAELVEPPGSFRGVQYQTTPVLLAQPAEQLAHPRTQSELQLRLILPVYLVSLAALTVSAMGFPGTAARPGRLPIELWLLGAAVVTQALGAGFVRLSWQTPEWLYLLHVAALAPLGAALAIAYRRLGWGLWWSRLRGWLAR